MIKITKIRKIRIIDDIIDTKNNPNVTGLKDQNSPFLQITALWLKLDLLDKYASDNL